jgi:hypothetical protein
VVAEAFAVALATIEEYKKLKADSDSEN